MRIYICTLCIYIYTYLHLCMPLFKWPKSKHFSSIVSIHEYTYIYMYIYIHIHIYAYKKIYIQIGDIMSNIDDYVNAHIATTKIYIE
jgi:hypothetical protein